LVAVAVKAACEDASSGLQVVETCVGLLDKSVVRILSDLMLWCNVLTANETSLCVFNAGTPEAYLSAQLGNSVAHIPHTATEAPHSIGIISLTRPAARKTSIESCQYKRVQYREAKECRKGRATLRETRSPFGGGRLGWNLICVEKEASLVISQWLVHEKEVQRFIVEMGWKKWVVSVELQMTSETGWGVVGASCWKSIKMGGVNNLMGSCSPGGC
jgi:hypothetical protein